MVLTNATIRQVAERAKVSTATVSRILNGKSGHRAATVESVRRIVSEIDREASQAAAAVRAPECIGIAMASYTDFLNTSYNSTLLTAIMESLTTEGFVAQLITRKPEQMNADFFRNCIRAYRLKGLIIPEFDTSYRVSRELNSFGIPIVSIGNLNGSESRCCIFVDDPAAGRDAATYLWSLGHRRFGFIGMSHYDISQRQRLTGFSEAIREAGGRPERIWTKEFRDLGDSATLAALEFARLPERPTALFSTNSFMTQKLLAELHRLGLRPPGDFSIISFEESNELQYLPTPVTVIAQPTRQMGFKAVELLFRLLRGQPAERQLQLDYSLNIRDSTGPCHIHAKPAREVTK